MFRAVANSPAALKSLWGSFGALGGGVLDAKLGEQIAVAVADRNGCEYCLAAHTMLGKKAGATCRADARCAGRRIVRSEDARRAAVRRCSSSIRAASVSDADVKAVRDAGYSDEAIVEILAHVALNLFTNYVNNALAVTVDFPATRLSQGGLSTFALEIARDTTVVVSRAIGAFESCRRTPIWPGRHVRPAATPAAPSA